MNGAVSRGDPAAFHIAGKGYVRSVSPQRALRLPALEADWWSQRDSVCAVRRVRPNAQRRVTDVLRLIGLVVVVFVLIGVVGAIVH